MVVNRTVEAANSIQLERTLKENMMRPDPDEFRVNAVDPSRFSAEPDLTWEEMLADSFAHLTEAQEVLQELAKGGVGPASAVMSCAEASHSVALALIALADAPAYGDPLDSIPQCLLRFAS